MTPDNNDNANWNAVHQGTRVPVNDTDIEGNPSAQGSHQAIWSPGSINKAIRTTWLSNGNSVEPGDIVDINSGISDLSSLTKYTIPQLLYGYNGPGYVTGDGIHGDAWFKTPGDAMSFRGYPTSTISIQFETIKYCDACYGLNLDGSIKSPLDSYVYLRARPELAFLVGYDTVVEFFWEGVTYELKITAGDYHPYWYRVKDAILWVELPQSYMFFSIPKPIIDTTYILRIFEVTHPLVYKNYVSPIELVVSLIEPTCSDWEWFFGPFVRKGGISDYYPTDPIEYIYNNPTTAEREIDGIAEYFFEGQLGQRVSDLQPDQSFSVGEEMRMGVNTVNTSECLTSVLNTENIKNEYLWIGTLVINGAGDPVYLIDKIWKIDPAGLLVGTVNPIGPPLNEVIYLYLPGMYEPGLHLNL